MFKWLRLRRAKKEAYKIILSGCRSSKILAIKRIRELTGLSLLEALIMVETIILNLFRGDLANFILLDKDNYYLNNIRSGHFKEEFNRHLEQVKETK
jgi:hypothetical protein